MKKTATQVDICGPGFLGCKASVTATKWSMQGPATFPSGDWNKRDLSLTTQWALGPSPKWLSRRVAAIETYQNAWHRPDKDLYETSGVPLCS